MTRDRTTDTDRLHVEACGPADAPLGLLIHPTSGVGAEMLGLAVADYRVLAPDRTNYGSSRRSIPGGIGRSMGQRPDVAMIEDDAEEIASMIGSGGHVFGYSYGGVVALTIASRHPQLVRTLTLLEPPAFQLLSDDPDVAETTGRFSSALCEKVYADPREFFRVFMSRCFGDPLPSPPDDTSLDRVLASMHEQIPWDVEIDLRAIADAGVPTLVLCGDWDRGFTAVARHIAEQLSGRLVQYSGATHFFMEQWGEIVTEMGALWQAHDHP